MARYIVSLDDLDCSNEPMGAHAPRPIRVVGGVLARFAVERALNLPPDVAEAWLRRALCSSSVIAWRGIYFVHEDFISESELSKALEDLRIFNDDSMAFWPLDDVCVLGESLKRALSQEVELGRAKDSADHQDADVGAEQTSEIPCRDMQPTAALHGPIRGDIDLQPSGITWVDAEYDERLQEAEPEPMQSNDRRFKTAAYEVHKASGMPLEIAEEALIEAVERRKVEAWKPFGLARSKQALRHLPSPVDPETRINGEQLNFWIKCTFGARDHSTNPINVGPPPRECVPFEVARAMAAEASGYDVSAARSWLVDAILVNKRIPGWHKPTAKYPAWRNPNAGDDPSDLYVVTEVLKQALAVEFGQLGRVCLETGQSGAGVTHGQRSPKGRPPMEFWPSVMAEVGQWLRHEGGEGEPGAQARVVEQLALAITKRRYEEPGETTLKKYARKVINDIMVDKGR